MRNNCIKAADHSLHRSKEEPLVESMNWENNVDDRLVIIIKTNRLYIKT